MDRLHRRNPKSNAPAALDGDVEPEADAGGGSTEADEWFNRAALMRAVTGEWSHQVQTLRDWWGGLNGGERTFLGVGAAAGAGVGLVLGLLVPFVAVSIQAAVVGSALLFFAGRGLLLSYAPGGGRLAAGGPAGGAAHPRAAHVARGAGAVGPADAGRPRPRRRTHFAAGT